MLRLVPLDCHLTRDSVRRAGGLEEGIQALMREEGLVRGPSVN